MAKEKIKKEEEVLKDVDTNDEVVETKKKSVKADSVSVVTKDNQVVRVYSLDVHGEDFYKLAEEFANKKEFSLK